MLLNAYMHAHTHTHVKYYNKSINKGKTVAMETPAESSVDGVVKSEDVVTKSENVSTTADAMESSDSVDVTVKTSDGSKECLDSPTSVPKETNNLTEDGSKETALKRKADPENKELVFWKFIFVLLVLKYLRDSEFYSKF